MYKHMGVNLKLWAFVWRHIDKFNYKSKSKRNWSWKNIFFIYKFYETELDKIIFATAAFVWLKPINHLTIKKTKQHDFKVILKLLALKFKRLRLILSFTSGSPMYISYFTRGLQTLKLKFSHFCSLFNLCHSSWI